MTDVSVWYKNIPMFTKYWFSLTIGISLLARFGILPEQYLTLQSYALFSKFQVINLRTNQNFIILFYFSDFLDMETNHLSFLLSAKSKYWLSFYAKLFLPLQLLT